MTAALDALRDASRKFAAPYASFQTATLIEAQASSAIEGIVTTIGEMIEHMDRPRLTNGTDSDTHDALRYYDSIIDAWQHRGRESVGTRWRSGRVRRPRAAACRCAADTGP